MPTIRLRGRCYDLHEPIKCAKRIAEIRGESERQTFHAIAERRFSFRNDGRMVVSTPFEVLEPLIGVAGITRLIIDDRAGHGDAPVGGEIKSAAVEAA